MQRVIIALALLSIVTAVGCEKREELVIAKVEQTEITVADFENSIELLEDRYLPATDDLEGKKQHLDNLINKEVMALKAFDAGYEREEWFQNMWQRFKNPFIVNAMMDQLIRKKVTVTQEEIDDYFQKMHKEYREQKTKNSIIARDADILECLIQAKEYYEHGYKEATKFMKKAPSKLKTKSAKRLWSLAKRTNLNKWWEALSRFER